MTSKFNCWSLKRKCRKNVIKPAVVNQIKSPQTKRITTINCSLILLPRVQISRETSTNNRYLYSSHSSRPREVQNLVCILTRPTGSSKYCTTRKSIQRYYTPKRLIRYIYLTIGSCFSVHYRVMVHVESLESTKEA